ncbi:MAG: site-specific tyrosine recombinase/integron integrase [Alloprevotella sp.]
MNELEDYRRYLWLERGLSENTRQAYLNDLSHFFDYLHDEGMALDAVRLDTIHHFSAVLSDLGISSRSIARIHSALRSFFGFLVLDGRLEGNPAELLESPKIGRHLPQVLSVAEVEAILGAVSLQEPEGVRNRAIIELLYSCGLRVSELCTLRLSDIYAEDGFIRVCGKGNKQRIVPVSARALRELEQWLPLRAEIVPKCGEEDFLFLSERRRSHLSRITVFVIVRRYAQLAGVTKEISPHTFRHSFATHLLEGGANLRAIQAMLGHERIGTTEIYTHIDRTFLRSQILEHFPRNAVRPSRTGGPGREE